MSTLPDLQQRANRGEKLAMLTCYDASFAARLEAAGIDALLVGDSLGMVFQGQIVDGYGLFTGNTAFANAFQQNTWTCLQVNDQVRFGRLGV